MYRFEHRPCYSRAPAWHIADHGVDNMYVSGAPFGSSVQIEGPWKDEDKAISRMMMAYWANFIKTGYDVCA